MKQLKELLDFRSKPHEHLMTYCGLFFVVANFLALIASVLVVATWSALVNRFFGVTQGLVFLSGFGLLLSFLKWRGLIRELQKQLSERFPNYASLILGGEELWTVLALAISVAGLFLTLVVPFGFLVLLVGLCLFEHQTFSMLVSLEEKEQKFFSEKHLEVSKCFSGTYDTTYLIYSLVTLYGHSFVKMQENFEALECYVEAREKLLGR